MEEKIKSFSLEKAKEVKAKKEDQNQKKIDSGAKSRHKGRKILGLIVLCLLLLFLFKFKDKLKAQNLNKVLKLIMGFK